MATPSRQLSASIGRLANAQQVLRLLIGCWHLPAEIMRSPNKVIEGILSLVSRAMVGAHSCCASFARW